MTTLFQDAQTNIGTIRSDLLNVETAFGNACAASGEGEVPVALQPLGSAIQALHASLQAAAEALGGHLGTTGAALGATPLDGTNLPPK